MAVSQGRTLAGELGGNLLKSISSYDGLTRGIPN